MYAVIQIPGFPLQALLRQMPKQPRGPIGVLDESGEQSRIITVNKIARRFGLSEGMHPVKALARCGNLSLFPRSVAAESEASRMLALLAQTLSHRIEETDSGIVTVNLRGTEKQGPPECCERLVQRFRSIGVHARIGIASTPDHALWASFFAKPVKVVRSIDAFLKQLPVGTAQMPEEFAMILDDWGIRTLAEFKRLPREEVGARLGQRGLNLWDTVAGNSIRLLKPFKATPRFHRKQEFEHRIETLEALLFTLKRFVEELALELQAARKAAYVFKLYLKLENKHVQRKYIEVPVPSSRATTLFRILETALENTRTQDPVTGVYLGLETTEARARQSDFFAVAMEDVVGFTETADRIAAIVGPGRSGSPRVNNTWRPDSFRLDEMDTEIQTEGSNESPPDAIGLPLERVRPPRPVRVFIQGERPVAIEGAEIKCVIKLAKGPWRLSSDWWDRDPWAREEWDIELEKGGLYRVFRNGKGWFLEGIYG